jgi:O-glycosyl hydrolase
MIPALPHRFASGVNRGEHLLPSLALALLLAACGSADIAGPRATDTTITVHAASRGQVIDGFGGTTLTLVYGGDDYLGGLRPAALEAAYGQVRLSRGLMNLGPVEAPADALGHWVQRRNDNLDPFSIDPAGFNFTGSARLRDRILVPAAVHGFTGLELGALLNLRGALDWLRPIRTADYNRYLDEAAEHVLAVMQHWQGAWGTTPPLLYLFNEPTSGNVELVTNSTQEVVDLVKRVGQRLRAGGFPETRFIVPNEESMARSLAVAQALLMDPEAREFVGAIGFHQYPYGSAYASPRRILASSGAGIPDPAALAELEQLRALGARYGVPLWMTEVSEGPGNSDFPFDAMESVLARTIHIHDLFRHGGVSAYFGMLTLWDSRSHAEHFPGGRVPFLTEQSGVVLVDLEANRVRITGMGYAIGHFARWLGPGARWVESSSSDPRVLVSAFDDTGRNRLVLVVANAAATSRLLRINLDGAVAAGAIIGERSSGSARWQVVEGTAPRVDGTLDISLSARSVISLAIPLPP